MPKIAQFKPTNYNVVTLNCFKPHIGEHMRAREPFKVERV